VRGWNKIKNQKLKIKNLERQGERSQVNGEMTVSAKDHEQNPPKLKIGAVRLSGQCLIMSVDYSTVFDF
jgi:hypothetical protein